MEEALDDMVKSLLVQTDSDDKDRWGLRGHVGVWGGGGATVKLRFCWGEKCDLSVN